MLRISTPKNQESSAAFLGSAAHSAGPVRDEEGDTLFMPTDTPQDRLIAQLYSKGVVDEFGHFIPTIDFSLPPFESAQMDCFRSFLESPFEIHDHSGAFLLKISLLEILQFFSKNFGTMIQNIDIVGGFVRSLLLMSPNYCKRALGSLGVEDVDNVITDGLFDDFHRKLPDYDIRIWAPGAQTGDLYRFTGALVAYFVSKMGNRPQSWVEKNAFSKFNVVFDGRNRFSIASFGQRELLFIRDLERSHLFLLDALRINVFDGYFFSKDPVIQGDYAKGWQSIIDLLAKVIHVDQLQTINHFGFPMLMSYLSRGYVLGDVQVGGMNVLESLIKRTLIPSSKYHSLPEQVADYLFICVENHHERDPLAAITVVFNACVHLEGSFSEREIELIWQSVMERFPYQEVPDSRSKEFLLKVMVCIVKDKIPFGVVRTLVAFGGFVQLGMPKSMAGDEGINIRKHNGKPCLQIRSSPNYILVPFNSCFEILLEYGLKDSTTREQEASLLSLFESLLEVKEFSEDGDVPLAKHMSRLSLDREAVYLLAEKLSGRKQHYLRVFGFYLSLSLASTNPSSRCLLQHLKHFPEIFSYQSNIPLKKQLVAQVNYLMRQTEYSSLPASENNPITKLYDHATKRASVTSQLLVWILALAQTQDSKMLHLSFELWERYAPKCSTKQRNQLGVKLLFQFLPNEISRAQQMLKSLQEEDPRIPFEQELEAWVAIMAAYQNMKSDSFLVGNLLQICQLTENLLDRELFSSGSAAFTRKFSWLLSHIPIPKEFRLVKKLLTRATEKGFLVSSEKEASLSWMQLCEAGLTHPDCGPKDVFAMWDHADQYGIWSSAALPPRYMTLMTSMAERLILSEDAKPMAIDILDSIVQKGVPDESLAKRVSVLALRHMRDLLFCRQSDETFYENLSHFNEHYKPVVRKGPFFDGMFRLLDESFKSYRFERCLDIWKSLITEIPDEKRKGQLKIATLNFLQYFTRDDASQGDLNHAYTIIGNRHLSSCVDAVEEVRLSYLLLCMKGAFRFPLTESKFFLYTLIGTYLQQARFPHHGFNPSCPSQHLQAIDTLLRMLKESWNPGDSLPQKLKNVLACSFSNMIDHLKKGGEEARICQLIYWLDLHKIQVDISERMAEQCFEAVTLYFEQSPNDAQREKIVKEILSCLQQGKFLKSPPPKALLIQAAIKMAKTYLLTNQLEQSRFWIEKGIVEDRENTCGLDYLKWAGQVASLEFDMAVKCLKQWEIRFRASEEVDDICKTAWKKGDKSLAEFYLTLQSFLARTLTSSRLNKDVCAVITRLNKCPAENIEYSLRILTAYKLQNPALWKETLKLTAEIKDKKIHVMAWALFKKKFVDGKLFPVSHADLADIWIEALTLLTRLNNPDCIKMLRETLDLGSKFSRVFNHSERKFQACSLIIRGCLPQLSRSTKTHNVANQIVSLRTTFDETPAPELDLAIIRAFIKTRQVEYFLYGCRKLLEILPDQRLSDDRIISLYYQVLEEGYNLEPFEGGAEILSLICQLSEKVYEQYLNKLNVLRMLSALSSYASPLLSSPLIPKCLDRLLAMEGTSHSSASEVICNAVVAILKGGNSDSLNTTFRFLNDTTFCRLLGQEKKSFLWMYYRSLKIAECSDTHYETQLKLLIDDHNKIIHSKQAQQQWAECCVDSLVGQLLQSEDFDLFTGSLTAFFQAAEGRNRFFGVHREEHCVTSSLTLLKGCPSTSVTCEGEREDSQSLFIPVVTLLQPQKETEEFREFAERFFWMMSLLFQKFIKQSYHSEKLLIAISYFISLNMMGLYDRFSSALGGPGPKATEFGKLLDSYVFFIEPNPKISFESHKLYVGTLMSKIVGSTDVVLYLDHVELLIHPLYYVELDMSQVVRFDAQGTSEAAGEVRNGIKTLLDRVLAFSNPFSVLHAIGIYRFAKYPFFYEDPKFFFRFFSRLIDKLDLFPFYMYANFGLFQWIEGGIFLDRNSAATGLPVRKNGVGEVWRRMQGRLSELLFKKVYSIYKKHDVFPTEFPYSRPLLLAWNGSFLLEALRRSAFRTKEGQHKFYELAASMFSDILQEIKVSSSKEHKHELAKIVFEMLLGPDSDLALVGAIVKPGPLSEEIRICRGALLKRWLSELINLDDSDIIEWVEKEFLPILTSKGAFSRRDYKALKKIKSKLSQVAHSNPGV